MPGLTGQILDYWIYDQYSMASQNSLSRPHRSRLMQVWRSAGWPCKDDIEIELLAAQLLILQSAPDGRETLRLTEAAIQLLAQARQKGQRALSLHDRLAQKFAEAQLLPSGRVVWRELSLRALIEQEITPVAASALWPDEDLPEAERAARNVWRMARPDLFSVRNTSVEAYLQPMVHEVKASRADLLSDLRFDAKRQAYRWLASECYYLFPAGVAEPEEIPESFGVWVLHGDIETGRFELLRPAQHVDMKLPFPVWMALAKATPMVNEGDAAQAELA